MNRLRSVCAICAGLMLLIVAQACGSESTADLDSRPDLRYSAAKQRMLEQINQHREARGLRSFRLGTNPAAQLHAESSLEDCVSGHWDKDGLSSQIKYNLTGGNQPGGIANFGTNFCLDESTDTAPLVDPTDELIYLVDGWMSGESSNPLLDPWKTVVSIGVAYHDYDMETYLITESDYVIYDHPPRVENGELFLEGSTMPPVWFDAPDQLIVQIQYQPPPQPLTIGQLARSSCLVGDDLILSLVPPKNVGLYQSTDPFELTYNRCRLPREIRADLPPPQSINEGRQLLSRASSWTKSVTTMVPQRRASEWSVDGSKFAVRANIADELNQFGPGVYIINVHYYADETGKPLSSHAIFHRIPRPTIYDRWATPVAEGTPVSPWTPTAGPTHPPTSTPTAIPTRLPTSTPFVLATPSFTETPVDRTK